MKHIVPLLALLITITACTKEQVVHSVSKTLQSTCEAYSDQCSCDTCDTIPTKTSSQRK